MFIQIGCYVIAGLLVIAIFYPIAKELYYSIKIRIMENRSKKQ